MDILGIDIAKANFDASTRAGQSSATRSSQTLRLGSINLTVGSRAIARTPAILCVLVWRRLATSGSISIVPE